jgi:signal transduction histidine kinase
LKACSALTRASVTGGRTARTPLANIRGYLEALKDGVITPNTALFTSLYEEAVLQQRLVDDLQDLAQAEAGAMIYHRTLLDVAELLGTGAGIKPADLRHVFDRFWRADNARGRTTGGSGLGLAIAREIVAVHHGSVTVDSVPGVGTTFMIRLPLNEPPFAPGADRARC